MMLKRVTYTWPRVDRDDSIARKVNSKSSCEDGIGTTADLGASSDHIQDNLCGLKWRIVPCEQPLITGQSVLSSR